MENTKIEWTDHTFNPWIGCTKVSPACDHCYAEVSTASRSLNVNWGAGQPRHLTSDANWKLPTKWNANHDKFFAEHGRRQRVFCSSLADVFDNEIHNAWRQRLLSLIADTPNLDWLLLTKRIGNAERMLQDACQHDGRLMDANDRYRPLKNIWLGATICNQEEADRAIPKLLEVPAAVRFLSMEPLLGKVSLPWLHYGLLDPAHYNVVDWVIVGGESGPNARPMHPDWARDLRDQCAAAGKPFLFKQWGEWLPANSDGDTLTLTFPDAQHTGPINPEWQHTDGVSFAKVGKKAAGRMLDGRTHDEIPQVDA